jgi:adhesin/invasin
LQGNPTFVIANGGISVVTAVVIEPAGTPAPDGTEVFFFTNLGRVDPVGKTVRGVASVNFVSDSRSGQATVTAISGAARGEPPLTIAVGSALPERVLVTADPPVLSAQRHSRITATVFDADGNPVQNVPVSFSLDDTASAERLDSGGAFQYTNSNGQVFDTLRTQMPFGLATATVTVTATTANGTHGEVVVGIE